MRILIAGGSIVNWKPSSIIDKLSKHFDRPTVLNPIGLPFMVKFNGYNLVIWAPDITNDFPKAYPIKDKGTTLICSKVMREGYDEAWAVSTIFKMHANAVICIYKANPKKFGFKLIDALGNTWANTHSIEKLANAIHDFNYWSSGQIRRSYRHRKLIGDIKPHVEIENFIKLNTLLADRIKSHINTRYFGNFSTRCQRLFPSTRLMAEIFSFSPRNVDKRTITAKDLVHIIPPNYYGDRKPSVDAPIQVKIYQRFNDINFMIHGHASITSPKVPETERYYPCGDLREVNKIIKAMENGDRAINLKKHGFLIAASTIEDLSELIDRVEIMPHALIRETTL